MYLLNKGLCELSVSRFAKKGYILPDKMMVGIFVYVLGHMLTLVSLEAMQNISTLMIKI